MESCDPEQWLTLAYKQVDHMDPLVFEKSNETEIERKS